jgi:hypothetical protein
MSSMYPPWGAPWPPRGPPRRPSAGPSVAWAAVLWCLAALCLVGALVFGAAAATGFWVDDQMDTEGLTSSATVVGVDGDSITVRFTTEDDRRVITEFSWWWGERPAVDDRLDITNDPDNPSYVIAAGSSEDQLLATAFAVVATVALAVAVGTAVGGVLIHRARAAHRAWRGTPWGAAG